MYLSCLRIDVGESGGVPTVGRSWLTNRYRVHQRLCMAFPSKERLLADPDFLAPFVPGDFPLLGTGADRKRSDVGTQQLSHVHSARHDGEGFLFRIDPSRNGLQVLVQSALVPNWQYAFANFHGVLAEPPVVREYRPDFHPGQRLQFRLEANPTRKVDTKTGPDGVRRHGRRVPVEPGDCIAWLSRFGADGGFEVDPQQVRVDCSLVRVRKTSTGDDGVAYFSARFEGLLSVRDPESLRRKLAAGLGSAKAYGFGLMSIVPAAS